MAKHYKIRENTDRSITIKNVSPLYSILFENNSKTYPLRRFLTIIIYARKHNLHNPVLWIQIYC